MDVREDMLRDECGGEIARLIIVDSDNQAERVGLDRFAHHLHDCTVRVAHPLAAFAEIALHDRLESTRSAWGLQPQGAVCLLLIVADSCAARFNDLVSAIARYFPGTFVAACDPINGSSIRLLHGKRRTERPLEAPHPFRRVQPVAPETIDQSPRAPSTAPALRLVDYQPPASAQGRGEAAEIFVSHGRVAADVDDATSDDADLDDEPAPAVTRDEIAMLLRDDAPDDQSSATEASP